MFDNQILKEKKNEDDRDKVFKGIYSFSQQWESTYCVPRLWPREPWERKMTMEAKRQVFWGRSEHTKKWGSQKWLYNLWHYQVKSNTGLSIQQMLSSIHEGDRARKKESHSQSPQPLIKCPLCARSTAMSHT